MDLQLELRAAPEEVAADFAFARPHGAGRFEMLAEERGPLLMMRELWRSRTHFDDFRPPEMLAFLERADTLLTEPQTVSVAFWLPADAHA